MGGALGPLLARSSLPVNEWGQESDEKQDKLLLVEGLLVGCMVLGVYVFALLEVAQALSHWMQRLYA